jgi:hypothetical protein
MDLVAFTDHDSIGGALELLNDRPDLADVIVGEEVSCRLPDAQIDVHLAVYGMTEALHRDLQPLRGNVFDAIARLREADVFFALNHLLHFYRGQIPLDRYLRLLDEVPALEVRNGTMLAAHNTLVERIAGGSGFRVQGSGFSFARSAKSQSQNQNQNQNPELRTLNPEPRTRSHVPGDGCAFAMTAGSDAHTLRRVGTTWTDAPGRTRDEFLLSGREGLGRPGGLHGTTSTVAGDAYGVIGSYVAALAGFGPRDLGPAKRAACLAFAAVSLPFQFTTLLMAARSKAGEQRAVERLAAHLSSEEREPLQPSLDREHAELRRAQKEREPFRRASV